MTVKKATAQKDIFVAMSPKQSLRDATGQAGGLSGKKPGRVFVAMSGGVDSSVSAALLKEQGHRVTGVFIKVWQEQISGRECGWREERRDAMRVCATLGIPFKTLDLSKVYERDVVAYMLEEYKNGRTPNPDVMCNTHIKFGEFLRWAREQGADAIATGHYARVAKGDRGTTRKNSYRLFAGADENKDQSYFLWTLTQEQLAQAVFPVGGYHKREVRELARHFNLPTAEKKDSQGLCFLGPIDVRAFLKERIPSQGGAVLNELGENIGEHEGAAYYTIGQRRGFSVTRHAGETKPHYVIEKDVSHNTIVVSSKPAQRKDSRVTLTRTNYIADPLQAKKLSARFRYRQPLQECSLIDKERGIVAFKRASYDITPGQSLVFYDGNECLGGGIIAA